MTLDKCSIVLYSRSAEAQRVKKPAQDFPYEEGKRSECTEEQESGRIKKCSHIFTKRRNAHLLPSLVIVASSSVGL